jgi:hypothetical protein
MVKRKFLPNDPLLKPVRTVCSEIHALNVELHYLSVDSAVGRPAREQREQSGELP